jgi:hypothetical protein
MEFASGNGTGTYVLDATLNEYFVNPNVPNSTLSLVDGDFPQRVFSQGNIVPGLVLSGDGYPVNGFRCALNTSINNGDLGSITVVLQAQSGWSGTGVVVLQGGFDRYSNEDDNWVTIGIVSATIDTELVSVPLEVTDNQMWPSYRLQATTEDNAEGIINWAIGNMFTDLSAENVGGNSIKAQPHAGQGEIQVNSSKPFGRESEWFGNTGNTGVNQTEIATNPTPGGAS